MRARSPPRSEELYLQRYPTRSRFTLGCVGPGQFGRSLQNTFSCVAELSVPVSRKIQTRCARDLAILPMRMGGLGLRSATRCAESAFWASWVDALPMIRERKLHVADMVVFAMVGGQPQGCLGELQEFTRFDREGFWGDHRGQSSSMANDPRGVATRLAVLGFFCFRRVLQEDPSSFSHLSRASSFPLGTQCWSSARPRTAPEHVIPSHLFRTLLLERMQLPLQIDETRCSGCQSPLDALGKHRAACPSTGRLKTI